MLGYTHIGLISATAVGLVGHCLLTRSFSGKALAVKRVTENHGKRTPGVDGATWNTPEQKARAIQALQQRGYRSRPLKRVYLAKPNGRGPVSGDWAFIDFLQSACQDPLAPTIMPPK